MGLNCGCPAADSLPTLEIPACREGLGQIQKVIFQRIYKTAGTKNAEKVSVIKAIASMTPLFAKEDGEKMLITPYIQNPTSEPGEPRTFGGGNQTLNGQEVIIGGNPTTFNAIMYEQAQSVIKTMKQLQCEEVGVYLIDENGSIAGIGSTITEQQTTHPALMPIPINSLFIGDKKLGGFEEPDSNTIQWSFKPNWSDDLTIVKGDELDYSPLTDLVNA